MVSSSSAIERGVKPREMIARVAVCSGGSWLIRITRCSSICSRSISPGNRMIAPFSAVDQFLLSLEIAETSSWRVTAQ